MQKTLRWAALGLALLAGACDAPTSPADSPARAPATAPGQADLQVLARSVALGLQDDAARGAVRDALRDSPWNEHKVSLQEFLSTDGGRALLSAAAAASGESADALLARAGRLPAMEMYVPSRDQRRSWRGTPDVAVAATLDGDAGTIAGFDARGGALADALNSGAGAVLLLAPAEFRTERIRPQPRGAGEVIQAASDGESAKVLVTWTDAEGNTTEIDYEAVLAGRDPRFAPVTNHTSGSVTRLEAIAGFMYDPGDLELGVRAYFYAPDNSLVGYATWKNPGVERNTTIYPQHTLFSHVIPDGGTARIVIDVWELDDCYNFCGDDNSYGTGTFYWNDRDYTKTIFCPSGNSVCTSGEAVANVKLHWNARAASVLTAVQVVADDIFVNQYGHAIAKAVDQYGYGLPGYSVSSWSIADPSIASLVSTSGSSATYYGNTTGGTTIYATINGITGSDSFYVDVDWGPCDPNDPTKPC